MNKKENSELTEEELKEIKDLERRARIAIWRALTGRVEGEVVISKRITFVKEDEDGNVIEETTYENPHFIKHVREHLRSRRPPHPRKLITVDEVIEIHDRLIRKYGGKSGVLNKGLLGFPVEWINQRRSLFWKVAVLMRGIICRHPFVDGNKRTGLMVADIILESNGYQFVDEDEVKRFVLELARSEKEIDEIVDWLKSEVNKVSARSMPERPFEELRPKYERALRRSMQRFNRILKELSEM